MCIINEPLRYCMYMYMCACVVVSNWYTCMYVLSSVGGPGESCDCANDERQ
jgi:hypothetical protein